jgi:type III secretion protein R
MAEFLPLIVVLAGLAVAPFAAIMVTSYAKIVIILGLLRQSLGLQQVPPNMVINGIAIVLTLYVMSPVGIQINDNLRSAGKSFSTLSKIEDFKSLLDAGEPPLVAFLSKHSTERDQRFFQRTAARLWPAGKAREAGGADLLVLVPAFTVSELTEAFKVGFMLFLAFLIVDLIVANVLLALGMSMVSPTLLSIPFKLLLFVMLDGWARLLQGVVLTYV